MSVKQFAAQMKASIEELKAKGVSNLSCDGIIAYLNEVENAPNVEPSIIDIEHLKAKFQNIADSNKHQHEMKIELLRGTLNAGQGAIKSSFLLNGGGAIALLAFITHLAQFKAEKVPEFATCLLPFTLGVFAIAVTSGLTYLSQWFTDHHQPWGYKLGYGTNIACIVLGVVSYLLFLWGMLSAHWAFEVYV